MPRAKFKTDKEWLDVIQACRTSGMTDKDWCRSNGISQTTLYRHINRLKMKNYSILDHCHVQLDKGHEVVPVEFDGLTELDQKYVRLSPEEKNYAVSVSESASSGVHVAVGKFRIDIDNDANASVLQDTLSILQRLC